MEKWLLLAFLLAALPKCFTKADEPKRTTWTIDGVERESAVYLPQKPTGRQPVSVMKGASDERSSQMASRRRLHEDRNLKLTRAAFFWHGRGSIRAWVSPFSHAHCRLCSASGLSTQIK